MGFHLLAPLCSMCTMSSLLNVCVVVVVVGIVCYCIYTTPPMHSFLLFFFVFGRIVSYLLNDTVQQQILNDICFVTVLFFL